MEQRRRGQWQLVKDNTMSRHYSRYTYFDTFSLDGNADMVFGLLLLIIGALLSFVFPLLTIILGIGIGIYFFVSIIVHASVGEEPYEKELRSIFDNTIHIQPTTSAPITDESTIADKIKAIHIATNFKCPSCGATVKPTDMKCEHCDSFLVAAANLPKPEVWRDIEIGQSVQVQHPVKNRLSLAVTSRVYYGELWQTEMKSNVPWTLTGNYYVTLGLRNGMLLKNWQSRFYILDSHQQLTDTIINQNFAQPARRFAASNQTAYVSFEYQGIDWRMEDIGRFRIEYVEGNEATVDPGTIGRFIHASDVNQILVIEDYQSGGNGLDTSWHGYQIKEQDIKF